MSTNDARAVVVLTTAADDASARELATALVRENLAACVTRTAVRSVYRWEETPAGAAAKPAHEMAIVEDDEVLLVIKTAKGKLAALERRVLELHRYSCPEFVAIAPDHVEERYLAWLLGACAATDAT